MSNRMRQAGAGQPADKVVALSQTPAAPEPRRQTMDWSSAIELVEEAGQAIRIAEERAEELEVQLDQIMAQAGDEVRRLQGELTAVEQRLAASEEKARLSEARAVEAETWLTRLNETIISTFMPLVRRGGQPPAQNMARGA